MLWGASDHLFEILWTEAWALSLTMWITVELHRRAFLLAWWTQKCVADCCYWILIVFLKYIWPFEKSLFNEWIQVLIFFFHFLYSYDTWVHSNDVDAEVEDPPIPEKPWKVKDSFFKNVFLHNFTALFSYSPQCFLRRYRIMIFLSRHPVKSYPVAMKASLSRSSMKCLQWYLRRPQSQVDHDLR